MPEPPKVLLKDGKPIASTSPMGTGEVQRPHETELERKRALLARVRATKASLISQLSQIEGRSPTKHYSWVNRHEARVMTYRTMGYEICRDPNVKTQWRQSDGTHVRGDLVLMEIDQDLYEAWQYESERSAIEAVEAAQDTFREFAGRSGVPVYETSR